MTPTPKDAERLAFRRALAIARVRIEGRGIGPLRVQITCTQTEGGKWAAIATARSGDEQVVRERAEGEDPTAALLALPDVLARRIEEIRTQLMEGLREGVDLPEPDETPVRASAPRRKGGG